MEIVVQIVGHEGSQEITCIVINLYNNCSCCEVLYHCCHSSFFGCGSPDEFDTQDLGEDADHYLKNWYDQRQP